jgi:hypothetical protein
MVKEEALSQARVYEWYYVMPLCWLAASKIGMELLPILLAGSQHKRVTYTNCCITEY